METIPSTFIIVLKKNGWEERVPKPPNMATIKNITHIPIFSNKIKLGGYGYPSHRPKRKKSEAI